MHYCLFISIFDSQFSIKKGWSLVYCALECNIQQPWFGGTLWIYSKVVFNGQLIKALPSLYHLTPFLDSYPTVALPATPITLLTSMASRHIRSVWKKCGKLQDKSDMNMIQC